MSSLDQSDSYNANEETFVLLPSGHSELHGAMEYDIPFGVIYPVYNLDCENTQKLFKLVAKMYDLPISEATDDASRELLSDAVHTFICESPDLIKDLSDNGIDYVWSFVF